MYDLNSPLRREIKDMYKRKVYAASLCGIRPNSASGKFKEWHEDMLSGQDKEINKLIAAYISFFNSPEYKRLIASETLQDNAFMQIIRGNVNKNIRDIFENASEVASNLTRFLFGSGERDEVMEARKALYKQVAYDLSDMRPENVAKMFAEDGKLPDSWNPYEKGYEPDEITFAGDDPDIARQDEE